MRGSLAESGFLIKIGAPHFHLRQNLPKTISIAFIFLFEFRFVNKQAKDGNWRDGLESTDAFLQAGQQKFDPQELSGKHARALNSTQGSAQSTLISVFRSTLLTVVQT